MAKLGRKLSRECGMLSFPGIFSAVIPGRATWREPGIHNHGIVFGARWGASHHQTGSRGYGFRARASARPGMTTVGFRARRVAPPRNDKKRKL